MRYLDPASESTYSGNRTEDAQSLSCLLEHSMSSSCWFRSLLRKPDHVAEAVYPLSGFAHHHHHQHHHLRPLSNRQFHAREAIRSQSLILSRLHVVFSGGRSHGPSRSYPCPAGLLQEVRPLEPTWVICLPVHGNTVNGILQCLARALRFKVTNAPLCEGDSESTTSNPSSRCPLNAHMPLWSFLRYTWLLSWISCQLKPFRKF